MPEHASGGTRIQLYSFDGTHAAPVAVGPAKRG